MGAQDTSTKDYLSDADVFADAVNYYLYGGEKVVKPDSLKPLDSNLLLHVFGHETGDQGKSDRQKDMAVVRYRDVVRQWNVMKDDTCAYAIFGIEAQTQTHYAMAVRNNVYDAMQYAWQVEEIRAMHCAEGESGNSAEFLSGLHKGDHLVPVITICIYFGTEPWDGALSLRELFDLQDERLLPYIQDYRVLLIEPSRMKEEEFDKFSTDLGQVLRFMKAASDKKEMAKLMRDGGAYGGLNRKAARVIRDCAHVNVQMEEKEEINMCKAWEDAMEDVRQEEREAFQKREKEMCKAWEDAMEDVRQEEREASQKREKEMCKAWEDAMEDVRQEEREASQKREKEMCKAWEDAMEDVRQEEREASQKREKEMCKAWEDAMEKREVFASIEAYRELDLPETDIKTRIKGKYGLTEEEAHRYMMREST